MEPNADIEQNLSKVLIVIIKPDIIENNPISRLHNNKFFLKYICVYDIITTIILVLRQLL